VTRRRSEGCGGAASLLRAGAWGTGYQKTIMPSHCLLTNALALRTVMRDYRRSRSELEPVVNTRLRKILVSAYEHVPYYRDVMRSAGYDPAREYGGPADLQRLPILTKDLLKQHGVRRFVREGVDVERFFKDATSGSTGTPLQVWRSPKARSLQLARWLRVLLANGYRLTDKVLSFTSPARLKEGKTPLQRLGLLRRKAVDYCLSPKQLLQAVVDYRPEVIYGNRSQIDLVAHEVMKSGAKLPPIKLVVVGAEIVRDHHRRLYEEVYQAKVVEFYGSVELGIIAFESGRSAPGLEICED